MATRIKVPSNLRSATWYPQFEEISGSVSLPSNKRFGITKRVEGITPATLLQKVTNIRAQYPDVNNGAIPYNNTWVTMRAAEANAIKGIAEKSYNAIISPGQTVTVDITGLSVSNGDILGINNFTGLKKNGSDFYPSGVTINTSIPTNGTIRFTISNNGSGNADLTNTTLFSYYFRTVQEIAQNSYNYGIRKGTPAYFEFNENGIPFDKVEEIIHEIYNIIKANDPTVLSPADTELYTDYFEGLNGYSTDVSFGSTTLNNNDLRNILNSESSARGTSNYYSTGAFVYRNKFVGGYFDGIRIMFNGAGVFSQIFNIERAFMALSTRKVSIFGWGSFEGIGQAIDGSKWQRLPLTGGDIIRINRAEGSYTMTETQAFLTLFLANTYVMWNDGEMYGTDINCWSKGSVGGEAPWKTRWQPTGGAEVEYDENNPSHPKKVCQPGGSRWSDSAADNLNGAYSGVYLYDQIKNRCNTIIKYATFSYADNSGNHTGYISSNSPIQGSKGDGSVSGFNNSNYGQSTIVDIWEKKGPIIYDASGTGGNCIAILNLYAGLTESVTYTITTNSGVQTITHIGPELGIYTY